MLLRCYIVGCSRLSVTGNNRRKTRGGDERATSAKMTNRERSIVMWSRIVVFLLLCRDVYFHKALLRFVAANLSQSLINFNFKLFSFCLMVKVAKRLHVLLRKICFVLAVFRWTMQRFYCARTVCWRWVSRRCLLLITHFEFVGA